jgi:hypothetical protein
MFPIRGFGDPRDDEVGVTSATCLPSLSWWGLMRLLRTRSYGDFKRHLNLAHGSSGVVLSIETHLHGPKDDQKARVICKFVCRDGD